MLFRSFWQAGFESACHINRDGHRLDMVSRTQHDSHLREDYARLTERGIRVVREGVRWPLVDRAGRFDLSTLRPAVEAAREAGVQVIWTLFHYGTPDGLDPFSPRLADRFARYCGEVARYVNREIDETPFFAPVNEISFLAWAAGDVGYIYPYGVGRGAELKRNLVRAAIAGIEAIWAVNPDARIVHCDPLIHVVPPIDRPDLARAAADANGAQYQAWDMLAGGTDPELGGQPRYLDILGLNYYHSNQWEIGGARLPWDVGPRDPRRLSVSRLLETVHRRYHRPLVLSETSHVGAGRARWIREVARGVRTALRRNIPVHGICLYPIIDRPDWDDPGHWHNSGLWDLEENGAGALERRLCEPYAAMVERMQALLEREGCR
jgi:hypothetical protein